MDHCDCGLANFRLSQMFPKRLCRCLFSTPHYEHYCCKTNSAGSEALDDVVSLSLSPVGMNDLHVQTVVDQLVEQLFSPLLALNEHQQRRSEPLEVGEDKREN